VDEPDTQESVMARTRLDTQLQDLTTQIVKLGDLVNQSLGQSLAAVKQYDQALCGLVIASDETIDALRTDIEQKTFQALTLQQPLGGTDLRFLCSVPSIAGDLERMGDNAAGITKLLLRMAPLRGKESNGTPRETPALPHTRQPRTPSHMVSETSIIEGILSVGKEAQRVLQATMHAFVSKDAQTARTIWQEDDVVDVCYHMVRHDSMSLLSGIHAIAALQQDSLVLQRVTYWLWIAHNLERVADHCTTICERIVFILQGDATITPTGE
jgi:phosphate transport system protein